VFAFRATFYQILQLFLPSSALSFDLPCTTQHQRHVFNCSHVNPCSSVDYFPTQHLNRTFKIR
jgi:hypothetical protein